jgi:hypothetical protein
MSESLHSPDPAELTMQFASGYIASSCVNAAARLKIADLLSDGPKNVSDLAKKTGTVEDILYRMLRALASAGLFVEVQPRTFANTPTSEVLQADHPQTIRDMVIWIADAFHFDVYRDMMPTLRDGKTAVEHIHNKPPFEVIFSDPELARSFNNAMTTYSAMLIPAVLKAYDFSGIATLADIAGGHGTVLISILQKYPQMKGILFDLEHVVSGAKERIEKLGLSNRINIVSGDFFESVPKADAYIMKHIIHDWDDERALKILRNCALHLPRGGKVILLETVLAPGNEPHFGKWLDIEMFMLPGGRERTEEEFRHLLKQAGLRLTRIVPNETPLSVIESVLE